MKVNAKFYPTERSSCQDLQVILREDGHMVFGSGLDYVNCRYALESLKVSPKLGNVPREVSIPNFGLLVIESSPEVDAYLDQYTSTNVHAMESKKRWIIASIIAVPLTLFVLFKFVMPWLAIGFAHWVPDSAVSVASAHTLTTLEKSVLDPAELDPDLTQSLHSHFTQVISQLNTEHTDFRVLFYSSEVIGPNAFALPDGTIVFTQQLVDLFDADKALLTAVLLHEIGHIEHDHSMRLIAETLFTSLAISYFFGDVSGILELFGGATATVVNNQFTQELEWEADNFALSQMPSVGMDPKSFASAMAKLAEEYGSDAGVFERFLSSHPSLKQRIKNALEQQ